LVEIPVSWSPVNSDGFTQTHNEIGGVIINFKTGEGNETILVIYFSLPEIGLLVMIGVYLLFRSVKPRKVIQTTNNNSK